MLCSAVAVLAAGCGSSGSQVQIDYGMLANEVCGKLEAQTSSGSSATRLQSLETALAGLEALNPPADIRNYYFELVGNFKAAVDVLKANEQTLNRLSQRLKANPNDAAASKQFGAIVDRVQSHLNPAAAEAHTLGIDNCQKAFGG